MSPNRFGEDEPDDAGRVPHTCNHGWIGSRDVDHPRPCLVCKPWLEPVVRRADLALPVAVPGEAADRSGRRLRAVRDGD